MSLKKSEQFLSVSDRANQLLERIYSRSRHSIPEQTVDILTEFAKGSDQARSWRFIQFETIEKYCIKRL